MLPAVTLVSHLSAALTQCTRCADTGLHQVRLGPSHAVDNFRLMSTAGAHWLHACRPRPQCTALLYREQHSSELKRAACCRSWWQQAS